VNVLEISVLSPQAALRSFAETWRLADAGSSGSSRLAFNSMRELFSAITEKRLELLRHVAAHDGLNAHKLAAALGRDYKNVHTDVVELVALGLLDRAHDGALSSPFDEIVIHAGIRDAA
jgi:predicted transcriptional regulator